MKKLFCFLLTGFLCLTLLIISLYFLFKYSTGLVLLYTPYLILLVSFLGVCIYSVWYHDFFEKFLIYITYVSALFLFVILIPIVIERSLSSFIYFYSVEEGSFDQTFISCNYMDKFTHKRFEDGVKGGFLKENNQVYYPTTKAKIFYHVLYPLGFITGTLGNYEAFKAEIIPKQNNTYSQRR